MSRSGPSRAWPPPGPTELGCHPGLVREKCTFAISRVHRIALAGFVDKAVILQRPSKRHAGHQVRGCWRRVRFRLFRCSPCSKLFYAAPLVRPACLSATPIIPFRANIFPQCKRNRSLVAECLLAESIPIDMQL